MVGRRDARPVAAAGLGLFLGCLAIASRSRGGSETLVTSLSSTDDWTDSVAARGMVHPTPKEAMTSSSKRAAQRDAGDPSKPTSFTSGALLYKRTHAASDAVAAVDFVSSKLGLPLDLNGTYHCGDGTPGFTATLEDRSDLCARRALFSGLGGFSVHYYESHTTQDGAITVGDWVDAWTTMHNFSDPAFEWNEFMHQGMTFWAPTLDPFLGFWGHDVAVLYRKYVETDVDVVYSARVVVPGSGHVVEIVSRNVSDPKPFANYSEYGECPESNHLTATMADLESQWAKFGGSSHADDLGLPDLLIAQITMPVPNAEDTSRFGDFLRAHLSPEDQKTLTTGDRQDGELKTPEALIYRPPGGTYPAMDFPDGTPAYPAGNTYRCLWPSENDDEDPEWKKMFMTDSEEDVAIATPHRNAHSASAPPASSSPKICCHGG